MRLDESYNLSQCKSRQISTVRRTSGLQKSYPREPPRPCKMSCKNFAQHTQPVRATALTPFPRRGSRLGNRPRRVPSVRPLCLAPWASRPAPGLVRTARPPATIASVGPPADEQLFSPCWPATCRLEKSSEKAYKNAKH